MSPWRGRYSKGRSDVERKLASGWARDGGLRGAADLVAEERAQAPLQVRRHLHAAHLCRELLRSAVRREVGAAGGTDLEMRLEPLERLRSQLAVEILGQLLDRLPTGHRRGPGTRAGSPRSVLLGSVVSGELPRKRTEPPARTTAEYPRVIPFRHSGHRPRFGLLAALLQELGDEARPARLVARAHAGTVVAVEVFVEENQVAPVGVPLERFRPAEDRPAPVFAAQEDPGEPPRELAGDLPEVQPS